MRFLVYQYTTVHFSLNKSEYSIIMQYYFLQEY